MSLVEHSGADFLIGLFLVTQVLYTLTFVLETYFILLPIDKVEVPETEHQGEHPFIVLFYPVLRELESTMETTMVSLSKLDYPPDRYRVVAIPNSTDLVTIAALERLREKFSFLDILPVPPTADGSWSPVWESWDKTPKAYWWHRGPRAKLKDLPPKKTRQLIYAFYKVAKELQHEPDLLINYIDADSAPPPDHFKGALAGYKHYDVLQAQNVAGNLNASLPASWHSFDHMAWDGSKYPHISAHGRQPFWVLGKGLFFKAKDLVELGGFHPWLTIEDPEVGLRFWKNGKTLGILSSSLIEEVPERWIEGVNQRKRWVCGFFQALNDPLNEMNFTFLERVKSWLLFLPCLSLAVNSVGVPTGLWALWEYFSGSHVVPDWGLWFATVNLTAFAVFMTLLYINTWKRTGLVLDSWASRAWYLLRVNPVSLMIWWLLWIIPLAIGFRMFLLDQGLVWQRTEKINANNDLVRQKLAETTET